MEGAVTKPEVYECDERPLLPEKRYFVTGASNAGEVMSALREHEVPTVGEEFPEDEPRWRVLSVSITPDASGLDAWVTTLRYEPIGG